MKKFLLSISIILCFTGYSLYQHIAGQKLTLINPVIAPKTIPNVGLSNPVPTQSTPTPSASASAPISTYQNVAVPIPNTPSPQPQFGQYKNGSYIGDVTDAYYGNVQVKVAISGGKISDVTFLQYPNDRQTSMMINLQAMPYLRQEAIQAQSANVDIVSGATDTSMAFQQSLQSALNKAKI